MKAYNIEMAIAHPFKTTVLYLHGLLLEELPEELFYLPNLKRLEATKNELTTISNRILELEQLEEIVFSDNHFEKIPEVLLELPNLKVIDFSKNKISELPDGLATKQILKTLKLDRNKITVLPEWIGQLKELVQLNFSHNQLRKLPSTIAKLRQLEEVDFQGNKIKRLPVGIGNSTKLKRLNISFNLLEQLPDSIGDCKNLIRVELQSNRLKELPESICNCPEITLLNLSKNKLTFLPKQIGQLEKIDRLLLDKNELKELPESISKFRTLRQLLANFNQLTSLPTTVGQWKFIERLALNNNRLEELPPEITNIRSLRFLEVGKNKIQALPANLGNMTSLESLKCNDNELTQLPVSIQDLQRLKTLHLSKNPFTEFPRELLTLDKLKSLRGLETIYTTVQRSQLKQFLKLCRTKRIAKTSRLTFYQLMTELLEVSQNIPLQTLFKALTLKLKIDLKALELILKKSKQQLEQSPLQKGITIACLGKMHQSKREIQKRLVNADLEYSTKIDASVSHIVLGLNPRLASCPETDSFVFLSEQQLHQFLLKGESTNLLKIEEEERIVQLKELLLSDKEEDIEIALGILKSRGVLPSLYTSLLIAHKTTSNLSQKKESKKRLALHVSARSLASISRLSFASSKQVQLEERLKTQLQNTDFNYQEILEKLQKKMPHSN